MKKLALGCLSILTFLIVLYTTVWIVHEAKKDTIKINEQEISDLEKGFDEIVQNWEGIMTLLATKFDKKHYLSKNDFIQLLESSNISASKISTLKKIVLDNSTIEIYDETFGFEIYRSSDPHIFFPDCYRHYISLDSKDECPKLYSFQGHDIIKDKLLGKKLRYIISRHFWD